MGRTAIERKECNFKTVVTWINALIVIAISFLVTILHGIFKVSVEAENKEHFEHEATEVIHLFLDRLSKYEGCSKGWRFLYWP